MTFEGDFGFVLILDVLRNNLCYMLYVSLFEKDFLLANIYSQHSNCPPLFAEQLQC